MIPLGKIVRLQIQRSGLKLGPKPNQIYDPAALLVVPELTLTARGTLARVAGQKVFDVHHADHPQTRNHDGTNDLSIGFTSHYAALRARYGPHLFEGCAGENILVECASRVELVQLARGVVIQGGAAAGVRLTRLIVALPCQPFSKFVARTSEPQAIKETLQFLDHGTRGFYGGVEGEATIKVGDEVFLA